MHVKIFTPWYKDRDFPEVKAGNDDIVAVILDPKQLARVIDDQNFLLSEIIRLKIELGHIKPKEIGSVTFNEDGTQTLTGCIKSVKEF